MTTPQFEELDKIARCAAGAYKRRGCRASFEDMHQEAWVAILMAQRSPSFDASRGTPFEAYVWSGTLRWLRGYLWKTSSPVSASYHCLADLRGVTSVEAPPEKTGGTPTPEDELVMAERKEAIFTAARKALAPMGSFTEPALHVIAGLVQLKDLKEAQTLERRELYNKLTEARMRLAASLELWHVWKGGSDASI